MPLEEALERVQLSKELVTDSGDSISEICCHESDANHSKRMLGTLLHVLQPYRHAQDDVCSRGHADRASVTTLSRQITSINFRGA